MIVSKATSAYVIMIVVLVGGLWMILAIGSTLIPPTDLAGKWELTSPTGPQELLVQQSGKFVNLKMGNWAGNLKIQPSGDQNSQQHSIVMAGEDQSVSFDNLGINDQCIIRFDGPAKGVYQAHRVVKSFH